MTCFQAHSDMAHKVLLQNHENQNSFHLLKTKRWSLRQVYTVTETRNKFKHKTFHMDQKSYALIVKQQERGGNNFNHLAEKKNWYGKY